MPMRAVALFVAVMGIVPVSAVARMQAPGDAKVYFIAPKNGEIIRGPVVVRFGLVGMLVANAGIEKENAGHHHLLIDTGLPKMDEEIPSDPKHLHFGEGETQATLRLPRGRHTLQLLFGDWTGVPHNPAVMSEPITITVQ